MRPCLLIAVVVCVVAGALPCAGAETMVAVNDQPITREALIERLLHLTTLGRDELEEMVNEALLFQAAQKEGVTVTEAEVEARVAEIKEKLEGENAFKRYLSEEGVSEKGLHHKVRVKMLVEKVLGPEGQVTEEEVRASFEANKDAFRAPETATLRVIITDTEERIQQAYQRLQGGESFADVAQALSEHVATAQQGGFAGKVPRGALPPVLDAAAFSAAIGSYTAPVSTDDGHFILQIEARTPAIEPEFEHFKEAIRDTLTGRKLQNAWVTWLRQARESAAIEWKWQP